MTNHKHALKPYVAMVEGEDAGVPFRVFFKYLKSAEQVAIDTHGVLTDLRTGERKRWIEASQSFIDA